MFYFQWFNCMCWMTWVVSKALLVCYTCFKSAMSLLLGRTGVSGSCWPWKMTSIVRLQKSDPQRVSILSFTLSSSLHLHSVGRVDSRRCLSFSIYSCPSKLSCIILAIVSESSQATECTHSIESRLEEAELKPTLARHVSSCLAQILKLRNLQANGANSLAANSLTIDLKIIDSMHWRFWREHGKTFANTSHSVQWRHFQATVFSSSFLQI